MKPKVIFIASYEDVLAAQEKLSQPNKPNTHTNDKSGRRYDRDQKQEVEQKTMSMLEVYMANGYTFVEKPPAGYYSNEEATEIALNSAMRQLEKYPGGGIVVDWDTQEVLYETAKGIWEDVVTKEGLGINIVGPSGEVVYQPLTDANKELETEGPKQNEKPEHDKYNPWKETQENEI